MGCFTSGDANLRKAFTTVTHALHLDQDRFFGKFTTDLVTGTEAGPAALMVEPASLPATFETG